LPSFCQLPRADSVLLGAGHAKKPAQQGDILEDHSIRSLDARLNAAGSGATRPVYLGLTMGHWHIASKDAEANKKLFLGMGGKLFMPGGAPLMMFPGVYINLTLGTEKGDGGTQGSVVNHVGFIVDNVPEQVGKWKAAGVAVLPQQQPARSGFRRDAGWRAYRDPGGQDAVDADPA
jgi:hypothetical protein